MSEENSNSGVKYKTAAAKPSKSKTKFVAVDKNGTAAGVLKLPGRIRCDCQATKHPLVNNCTGCGRIVCEQEGSGPCIHCQQLVCTSEEQRKLNENTKASRELLLKLTRNSSDRSNGESTTSLQAISKDLEKAIRDKDKLLEFDRNSAKRTKVIDDESDYFGFDNNTWMNADERAKVKKRYESLRNLRFRPSRWETPVTVTLDFAGRQVLPGDNDVGMYSSQQDMNDHPTVNPHQEPSSSVKDTSSKQLVELLAHIKLNNQSNKDSNSTLRTVRPNLTRLQDSDLQLMTDTGKCLSMHQPFASMLVAGIKKHEGRTWYSSHRGVLWIASASKPTTADEIKDLERRYCLLTNNDHLPFPSSYPPSCLLGCVEVVDCLSQDQYREKFPLGESDSPYVFICENSRELMVKFPITGKHKIYQLDPLIHQAAKKAFAN